MDQPTDRDWERLLIRLQEYVTTARNHLQQGNPVQGELTLGELEEVIQRELRDLHQDPQADEGEGSDEPSHDPSDDVSPLGLADA